MPCFTNQEEEAVGLASRATWLRETDIKEEVGVQFSKGEMWKPCMVEDRNRVTGQNPASASVVAKRLLEVLAERASGEAGEEPALQPGRGRLRAPRLSRRRGWCFVQPR